MEKIDIDLIKELENRKDSKGHCKEKRGGKKSKLINREQKKFTSSPGPGEMKKLSNHSKAINMKEEKVLDMELNRKKMNADSYEDLDACMNYKKSAFSSKEQIPIPSNKNEEEKEEEQNKVLLKQKEKEKEFEE